MKKLLLLSSFIAIASSVSAQNRDNIGHIEKVNADAPRIESGYDKEMDVLLLEEPYAAKDISNYRPVKSNNSPFNREEETRKADEEKPMMPWQKKNPLLWNKRRS